ncbi:MAG: MarR family transcriptional regulator [Burkholderiales bacterium]|nr:MarR family transcriptional regulator [Burkholderiales bacterium]MDE1928991.1 MarR family transcriptional regulator [Burkholderiales bacterium]MDE2159939.1 MarR family transcriptional regulator [Burkholderiales bacterium]MDE2502316.1 MarR family transcriptional regulator [Burkholderiales bacterium]
MTGSNDAAGPCIPGVGEGRRGVDGRIGYLFRQACAAHRIRMEHVLAPAGITLPQFTVLTMLDAYPGVYGADLARLTLLTPQTVCVIVGNLERDGLLARTEHPGHGRIRRLDLTGEGRARLSHCRAEVQALEAAMMAGLDPEACALIRRWLVGMAMPEAELMASSDARAPLLD